MLPLVPYLVLILALVLAIGEALSDFEGSMTLYVDPATKAPLAEPMQLPLSIERHVHAEPVAGPRRPVAPRADRPREDEAGNQAESRNRKRFSHEWASAAWESSEEEGEAERHEQPLGALDRRRRPDVQQRRVPQEVPEDRQGDDARRGPQPLAQRRRLTAGHDDPDRHPDQARVEHVPVEPAREHAHVEALEHPARRPAERRHEVDDVLDDGEPDAVYQETPWTRGLRAPACGCDNGPCELQDVLSASTKELGNSEKMALAKVHANVQLVHNPDKISIPNFAPEGQARSYGTAVRQVMDGAYAFSIPLSTEARWGHNWGEMQVLG